MNAASMMMQMCFIVYNWLPFLTMGAVERGHQLLLIVR